MLKNQKLTFLPAWAVCAAEEAEAPEPAAATAASSDEAVTKAFARVAFPSVPEELVAHIVSLWAHVGYY